MLSLWHQRLGVQLLARRLQLLDHHLSHEAILHILQSEGESETSHDDGLLTESSTSETEEEVMERHEALTGDVQADEEILRKGERRRLLAAAKMIGDSARTYTTKTKDSQTTSSAVEDFGDLHVVMHAIPGCEFHGMDFLGADYAG